MTCKPQQQNKTMQYLEGPTGDAPKEWFWPIASSSETWPVWALLFE